MQLTKSLKSLFFSALFIIFKVLFKIPEGPYCSFNSIPLVSQSFKKGIKLESYKELIFVTLSPIPVSALFSYIILFIKVDFPTPLLPITTIVKYLII